MHSHSNGEKFRALLATGRVANIPTVYTNVIVSTLMPLALLGITPISTSEDIFLDLIIYSLVMVMATSMLYVGGCMLGDYKDLAFDRENRPSRPLPRGVLSPKFLASLSYLLLALGFTLSSTASLLLLFIFSISNIGLSETLQFLYQIGDFINPPQMIASLLLTACIIIYALTHKKTGKHALLNMALCRFLLIIYAATSFSWFWFDKSALAPDTYWIIGSSLIYALAVGAYTYLLSSVASTESTPEHYRRRKTLATIWFILPFSVIPLVNNILANLDYRAATTLASTLIAIIIYYSWGYYTFRALKTSKPTFVSRALAGFCLLDMCFAATFSPLLAILCLGLFLLALLLQKFAPAT